MWYTGAFHLSACFVFKFSLLYDEFCSNLISEFPLKCDWQVNFGSLIWFIPFQYVDYIVCMKHKFTFINVVKDSTPYNKQLCDTKCRLLWYMGFNCDISSYCDFYMKWSSVVDVKLCLAFWGQTTGRLFGNSIKRIFGLTREAVTGG